MFNFTQSTIIIKVVILLMSTNGNSQPIITKSVEKLFALRAVHSSIEYSVDFYNKPFIADDTTIYKSSVKLVRDSKDSLFEGLVYLNLDTLWLGYDGSRLMRFEKLNRTLLFDDAVENPDLFIKSTLYNNLVDDGFLRMNHDWIQLMNDETVEKRIQDTIVDGYPCLALTYKFPDLDGLHEPTLFVVFDTTHLCIRRKMYKAGFQGSEEYKFWSYSNIVYGNENEIPELNMYSISDIIKKEVYIDNIKDSLSQFKFDFGKLSGEMLVTGEEFGINFNSPKFTILDFWYTSCLPCIESIPFIRELTTTYKSKGVVVYGVNIVDDAIKSKARLEKFLVDNPMPYETIMVDPELRKSIQLEAFPTFLILDDHYQIVYKEVGFNENLVAEVSEFLNKRLK